MGGGNSAWADDAITLWSENFSSYSADNVPSGGTYSYSCSNGGGTTKIYAANLAGGSSPELLVGKSSGNFTATVPLDNIDGDLTLKYKTNANSLTVSTTTTGLSVKGTASYSTAEEHTVTFTGITTSTTSITIIFTAGSKNVRLDDIVLTGIKAAPSYTLIGTTNNSDYGTVSVDDNVITASPEDGYRVSTTSAYTITSGESNVSNVAQSGNVFTVTATGDCTVQINFEAIPTHEMTITTPTGGTLTVKNGDDVISSGSSVREGTTLTIVPAADSSHKFAKWTATVGNTSTNYTDVFTYTVPASDFTLSATFDEVVKYAVNWSVNGNVSTEYYEENEDIVFPDDPDDIEGKEFMGWCATTVATTDTEPTFVTSATMGTSALTYYAVFAKRTIGDTETKNLVITNKDFTDNLSGSYSEVTISKTIGGNTYNIKVQGCKQSDMCQLRDNATLSYIYIPELPGNISNVSTTDCQSPSASSYSGTIHIKTSKTRGNSDADDIVKSALTGATTFSIDVTGSNKSIYLFTSAGLRIADLTVQYKEKIPDTFSAYETTVPLKYALTFSNPTGGTIAVVDENEEDVSTGDRFYADTELTITATPSTGYSFSSWSATAGTIGSSTTASTTFTTAESVATLSATFTKNTYTLSTSATNGTLAVEVDGDDWDGSSKIPYGSTVVITPEPADGYVFSEWSSSDIDGLNTTSTPLEFTMPAKNVSVTGNFLSANIDYNIAVSDELPDGVSVSIADDATTAKAGNKIVISYSESDDYDFLSWNVVDEDENTVTVSYDEGKDEYYFTMPAKDVTVGATYQRMYKITYKVTGEDDVVSRVASGSTLDISEPASGPDFTFAGWSESNTISSTPTFATATTVTGNKTLYAIYIAKAGATIYQKVTSGAVTDGTYLFVYEAGGVALDGSLSDIDVVDNSIPVSPSDGVIASTTATNNASFTYDATAGTLLGTSGNYIGHTGSKNTLDKSASSDAFSNTLSISSGDVTVQCGTYYLRYNATSGQTRFRYYGSSTSQDAIQLYKKVTTPAVYTLGESVSVTVSSAGYATYCSDKALDFSKTSGLKAYIVTSDGSTTDYTEVTSVPANTGLLLKASAGTYDAYIVGSSATDVSDNKLVGVLVNTGISATTDGKTNFVLRSTIQYGVGFYKVTAHNDGNPDFTVRANSAYLSVALADASRSFFGMPEDETTGLNDIRSKISEAREGIYDLQGRKIAQPTKGLYIVNGKKVIIK